MLSIRTFRPDDWPQVWKILEPVFRAGETYAVDIGISEGAARELWVASPVATFVGCEENQILGTYYIKTNNPGPGSHVCNCGYAVRASARGKGVATALCEHSQLQAVRMGYRGMQYNLVVSTNAGAVRLWQKLGFGVVGTLPGAFQHPEQGFVDGLVMFKQLL